MEEKITNTNLKHDENDCKFAFSSTIQMPITLCGFKVWREQKELWTRKWSLKTSRLPDRWEKQLCGKGLETTGDGTESGRMYPGFVTLKLFLLGLSEPACHRSN